MTDVTLDSTLICRLAVYQNLVVVEDRSERVET